MIVVERARMQVSICAKPKRHSQSVQAGCWWPSRSELRVWVSGMHGVSSAGAGKDRAEEDETTSEADPSAKCVCVWWKKRRGQQREKPRGHPYGHAYARTLVLQATLDQSQQQARRETCCCCETGTSAVLLGAALSSSAQRSLCLRCTAAESVRQRQGSQARAARCVFCRPSTPITVAASTLR